MYKLISFFQKLSVLAGFLAFILIAVPLVFGIKPYVVLSGSMEPKIKTGALAYVNKNVPATEINVGDVIGFNAGEGMVVTHRVVEINNEEFTTKGDANENVDGKKIAFGSYLGKTVFSIPYLGKLVSHFRTRNGVFWLTAIIGLNILCFLYDKKIHKEDYVEGSTKNGANNRELHVEKKTGIEGKNVSENIKINTENNNTQYLEEKDEKQNIEQLYSKLKLKSENTKRHAFENYTPEQKKQAYANMYSDVMKSKDKKNVKEKKIKKKAVFSTKCESEGKHSR